MATRTTAKRRTQEPLTWENAPEVLTVEEAAALIRISRNAVYGAIGAGLISAYRFGPRQTRIAKSALQQVFGVGQEDLPRTAAFSRNPGGTVK